MARKEEIIPQNNKPEQMNPTITKKRGKTTENGKLRGWPLEIGSKKTLEILGEPK
ncbi:hypothetical protein CCACVL1_09751 [Corchorus capsularis]|uniref:Uncharacterized protein n=1 Tax=Corchorus capsularis TaxID=210143 RepID=A0A1R3IUB9_COCAP|nr:hypothetical protein CCACVL1_09751 [Corchorus capsularis]